jgi:hypothetical protein
MRMALEAKPQKETKPTDALQANPQEVASQPALSFDITDQVTAEMPAPVQDEWFVATQTANVESRKKGELDSEFLLKQATAQKRGGDIDAAIRTLRLAYGAIEKGPMTYSVDVFLRLPLYLQETGRSDEAWAEFNKLIVEGHPSQLNDLSLRSMGHSKIYDKMRLFLQREGKSDRAIVFGVLSMLACAKGLYLQSRRRELAEFVSRKHIEATLEPLLKKAKRTALSEQLVEFMLQEVSDPSHLDLSGAAKWMRELMAKNTPPQP